MSDNKIELQSHESASEFYENFFEDKENYLVNWWTPHQFVKLSDVLKKIDLASDSKVFDFGCGVGDVTKKLASFLPGCRVTASDISSKAVRYAERKYPDIRFVTRDAAIRESELYDLVFSHHVFEHVVDIDEAFQEIESKLKPDGKILIACPCGNPGSLEYEIASNVRNGIDTQRGNRFFYEAPDHQRRLKTEDFVELGERHGFRVAGCFYADQYWGSIEWIARDGTSFLKKRLHSDNARNSEAQGTLARIRRALLPWCLGYGPMGKLKYKLGQSRKSTGDWVKILIGICSLPISYPASALLWSRVRSEWKHRKNDPAGAEIWVIFERSGIEAR